jgi:Flp pilus assembly protein TadG
MQETVMSNQRNIFYKFKKNHDGTVAIEFAILAPIFLLLLFAIIEVGIAFTAKQLLAKATDDLARDIRVGKIRNVSLTPTAAEKVALHNQIKTRICADLIVFFKSGCPDLEVDLNTYATFGDVIHAKASINATRTHIDNTGFTGDAGKAESIQHLRVFYAWPWYTDIIGSQLSQLSGNKYLMYYSQTWVNEPYT